MAKASGKYAQAISDRSVYIKQSLKQNTHSLKDKDMQVMHNH